MGQVESTPDTVLVTQPVVASPAQAASTPQVILTRQPTPAPTVQPQIVTLPTVQPQTVTLPTVQPQIVTLPTVQPPVVTLPSYNPPQVVVKPLIRPPTVPPANNVMFLGTNLDTQLFDANKRKLDVVILHRAGLEAQNPSGGVYALTPGEQQASTAAPVGAFEPVMPGPQAYQYGYHCGCPPSPPPMRALGPPPQMNNAPMFPYNQYNMYQ